MEKLNLTPSLNDGCQSCINDSLLCDNMTAIMVRELSAYSLDKDGIGTDTYEDARATLTSLRRRIHECDCDEVNPYATAYEYDLDHDIYRGNGST